MENTSNKTIFNCFDFSEVTDREDLLRDGNTNAELSSWDVSAVTNMNIVLIKQVCSIVMILVGIQQLLQAW